MVEKGTEVHQLQWLQVRKVLFEISLILNYSRDLSLDEFFKSAFSPQLGTPPTCKLVAERLKLAVKEVACRHGSKLYFSQCHGSSDLTSRQKIGSRNLLYIPSNLFCSLHLSFLTSFVPYIFCSIFQIKTKSEACINIQCLQAGLP